VVGHHHVRERADVRVDGPSLGDLSRADLALIGLDHDTRNLTVGEIADAARAAAARLTTAAAESTTTALTGAAACGAARTTRAP
jgi:hypothetical protein